MRALETGWSLSSLLNQVLDTSVDTVNLSKRSRVYSINGLLVMLSPTLFTLQVVVLCCVLILLSPLPKAQELELSVLTLIGQVSIELLDSFLPLADLALELLKVGLELGL